MLANIYLRKRKGMKKNLFKGFDELPEAKNFKGTMLRESEREKYYRRKNEERQQREVDAWFNENLGGILIWIVFGLIVVLIIGVFGEEGGTTQQSDTPISQRRAAEQNRTVEKPLRTERPDSQQQFRKPENTVPVTSTVSVIIDGAQPNTTVYVTLVIVGPGTGIRGCRTSNECFHLERAIEEIWWRERAPVGAAFAFSAPASSYGQASFDLPTRIVADGVTYIFGGPNFRIAYATSVHPIIISVPDFSPEFTLRLRARY